MLASRQWLTALAEEYSEAVGGVSAAATSRAMGDALGLLALAPWHFRLLIGCAEVAAAAWRIVYRTMRIAQGGRVEAAQELADFAKVPVISAPLLKVYRSLLALSWFEQPEVIAAFKAII